MASREYYTTQTRVRRNTGPVGGQYVCEVGHWVPDRIRGKRDHFRVERTVKVGTRQECMDAAKGGAQ